MNRSVEPVFERLEPRILLSGTPAPDDGAAEAVFVDVTNESGTELQDSVSEILFVDAGVENYDELIEGFDHNVEVIVIPSDANGIDLITSVLNNREGLTGVHIFSHGDAGEIHLGNTVLNEANLSSFQNQILSWRSSLSHDADILVYGCNFGQSDSMLQELAALSEADIAASDDLTGAEHLGGDAELEIKFGQIESKELFSQKDYDDARVVLPAPKVLKKGGDSNNETLQVDGSGFNISETLTAQDQDTAETVNVAVTGFSKTGNTGTLSDTDLQNMFSITPANVLDNTETEDKFTWTFDSGGENFGYLAAGSSLELRYTITATDSSNKTGTGTVTITIENSNNAPVASNDTGSVNEDATLNVVAANGVIQGGTADSDADGDSLTVSAIRTGTEAAGTGTAGTIGAGLVGTYGTLTMQDDGSYTYVADQAAADALAVGDTADDFFTYTVSDGKGGTDTAQLTITVTGINDAPTFTGNASLAAVSENSSDPSGDTVTNLFGGLFDDVDGDSFDGIAIAVDNSIAAEGTWQYSTDSGVNWYSVGSVSTTGALLLTPSSMLRFLPATNYSGTPGSLEVHAIDDTNALTFTSGATRQTFNTTTDGATSAVSAAAVELTTSITDTNAKPEFISSALYFWDADQPLASQPLNTVSVPSTVGSGIADLGNAWDFDGSDTLRADGLSSGVRNGDISGELWFKVDPSMADGDKYYLFETGGDGRGTTMWLEKTAGVYTLHLHIQPVSQADNASKIDLTYDVTSVIGNYIQAAWTVDIDSTAGTAKLYVNGAEVDTHTGVLPEWSGGNGTGIGSANSSISTTGDVTGITNFVGQIAQVSLHNSVLSATAIKSAYLDIVDSGAAVTEIDYKHNSAAKTIATDVPVRDLDSSNFDGGTLIVEITGNYETGNDVLATGYSYSGFASLTATDSKLTFNLNSSATPANVAALLQSVTFFSDGSDVNTRTVTFTVTDGDGGSNSFISSINVAAQNNAPVLVDTDYSLTSITEDETSNSGNTVASIIGANATDADAGDSVGIVITSITGNGTWQYKLSSGTWTDINLASGGLHLSSADSLRFVPDGENGETASFNFRAWDQTNDVDPGQNAVVGDTGGINAYSTHEDTASITVSDVNDAPDFNVLSPTFAFNPDNASQPLNASGLPGTVAASYPALGNAWNFNGTPATADNFNGYNNADASFETWVKIDTSVADGDYFIFETGATVHGTSLFISKSGTTYTAELFVRFNTNNEYRLSYDVSSLVGDYMQIGFSVDRSTNNGAIDLYVNGSEVDTVSGVALGNWAGGNATTIGGIVSGGSHSAHNEAGISPKNFVGQISQINFFNSILSSTDFTNSYNLTLAAINEDAADPSGETVANLFSSYFSDIDTGDTFAGIAVTDNLATAAQGNWEYTTDGTNWHDVGSVSDSSALLLTSTSKLRFNPAADYNGTPGIIAVHAVDDSNGSLAFTNGSSREVYNVSSAGSTSEVSASGIRLSTTVNAVNDPANISPADVDVNETNSAITTGGTLTSTDVDNEDNKFIAQSNVAGTNGTFSIDADGVWTYTANSAFDSLNVGDSVTDIFNVSSIDGTSSTVQVTINGTNDAATVSSADVDVNETDSAITTGGTLTSTDVDNDDNKFIAQSNVAGTNGTFSIDADGVWTYTANSAFDNLNVGDSVSDTFTVSSVDGTTSTVQVTINGTNDAATVSSADVDVNETDSAITTGGTLTSSDADNDDNKFIAQTDVAGTNGTFSIDADGVWTYTANSAFDSLNVGDSVTDIFNVSSIDGTSSTVQVTINGTNDAATVSSADVDVNETDSAITTGGTLTSTDVDNDDNKFIAQSNVAGTNGTFSIDADGVWTYTANSAFDNLNVGDSVSDTFTVSSVDGTTSTVQVTINGTNDSPVASDDSQGTGENTVLNSNVPAASDVDGTIASYTLVSDVSSGSLTFNSDGTYSFDPETDFDDLAPSATRDVTFTYYATDNNGADSGTQTITITVTGTNDSPVASDDSQGTGENTVLNSSVPAATDIDGTIASYSLVSDVAQGNLTFNSNGTYSFDPETDFDDLAPSATRDVSFTYKAIDNNGGESGTQTVTITITGTNDAPTFSANASLAAVNEDVTSPSGDTVSNLFGALFDDDDTGHTFGGIAVSGDNSTASQGTWQYNTGGGWFDIGAVSSTSALLLTTSTSLRFVPAADFAGTPGSLEAHAIDSSNAFTFTSDDTRQAFNTTTDDGTSPVSAAAAQLTTSVTNVNDAPVIDGGFTYIKYDWTDGSASLPDGAPDLSGVSGATEVERGRVDEIADASSDDGSFFAFHYTGTLIIENAGDYTFLTGSDDGSQLFIDGNLVVNNDGDHGYRERTGTVTLAAGTHQIDVTFYEWQGGDRLVTSFSGPDTANQMVRIGNVSMPKILETDTTNTGQLVSEIVDSRISDVDSGAATGIAITELGAAVGTWQYQLNGSSTWVDIDLGSGPLHLDAADRVRMLPDGVNGDNSFFIYRAWDQTNAVNAGDNSAIAATGGTTAYSDGYEVVMIAVEGVNAQPSIVSETVSPSSLNENQLADNSSDEEARYNGTISAVFTDADTGDNHSYELDGNITVSGPDSGIIVNTTSVTVNNNGSFSITNPDFNKLSAGESVTVSFDYFIQDDSGAANDSSSSRTVSVTINGTNDAPAIGQFEFTRYDWPNSAGNTLPGSVAGFQAAAGSVQATGFVNEIAEAATNDGSNFAYHYTGTINIETGGTYTFETGSDDGSLLFINGVQVVDNNGAHGYQTRNGNIVLAAGTHQIDVLFFERGGSDRLTTSYSGPDTGGVSSSIIAVSDVDFTTITEDDTNNSGTTVAALAGSTISDEDTSAVEGIAITELGSANGTWQYQLNGSSTWVDIDLSGGALHLRSTDSVRFQPDGVAGETSHIKYRAWDQTNSVVAGTTAAIGASGGETAYSAAVQQADITVTDVNDDPTAQNDTIATNEDSDVSGNVLNDNGSGADSDVDGDSFSVTEVNGIAADLGKEITLGSGALLTLNSNGSFSYDPNGKFESLAPGDTGNDSFTYTISDGNGGTDTATVTINIAGVNDAPTLTAGSISATEDALEAGISVNAAGSNLLGGASDVDDADNLLVVGTVNGSAANVGNGVTLTLSYNDGAGDPQTQDVTLTVNADGSYSISGFDLDDLPLGNNATGSFTYQVEDPDGALSSTETASVSISGTNDTPIATNDIATFTEDATLNVVKANGVIEGGTADSDPDKDPLEVSAIRTGTEAGTGTAGTVGSALTGTYGTLTIQDDGSYSYSADQAAANALAVGDTGTDTFTYTISDGKGGTDTAELVITVNGANDDPVANDDEVSTNEDTNLTGNLFADNAHGIDSDPVDGDMISVSAVNSDAANVGNQITLGSGALLTVNANGSFTYNPNGQFETLAAGASTTDTFNYTISDGNGGFDSATVTVTVNGVNDAPVITVDNNYDVSDLSSWNSDDNKPTGVNTQTPNWNVSGDTVEQKNNSHPAVFYSDFTLSGDYEGEFKFSTSSASDNDFVGFVLGYDPGGVNSDNSGFILVDWNREGENHGVMGTSTAGLAVSFVQGSDIEGGDYWKHDGDITEIARSTNFGSTGFSTSTEYKINFEVSGNNLKIYVDDVLEFDLDNTDFGLGALPGGRFGFYNFAYEDVTYEAVSFSSVGTPSITYTEGASPVTISPTMSISDIDSADFAGGTFTVEITANANAGQDVLSTGAFDFSAFATKDASSTDQKLVFNLNGTSTPALVQSLARAITYSNSSESPDTSTRTVTYTIVDGDGGTDTDTQDVQIFVESVNDAPAITLTDNIFTTNEETTVNITGITVGDNDAGTADLQLTLAVKSGSLSINNPNGGPETGANITISGTVTELNTALANLTYTPVADFNGSMNLKLTLNDLGNSGSGGALSDVENITVQVNPVIDVTIPTEVTTNEDTPVDITITADDSSESLTEIVFTGVNDGTLSGNGIVNNGGGQYTWTSDATTPAAIDFSTATVNSHGSDQDIDPTLFSVSDDGKGFNLTGNTWKNIDYNYTVTADTILEFEFRSDVEPELSMIMFDNNNAWNGGATPHFKLHGSQGFTDTASNAFNVYDDSGDWQKFSIKVGDYFTGAYSKLVFINDDDSGEKGNSFFRNVVLYESDPESSLTFTFTPDADRETDTAISASVKTYDSGVVNTEGPQNIDIKITPVNDKPVITVEASDSDSDGLTETNSTLSASGTLTVTDPDLADVVTFSTDSVMKSGVTTGLGSSDSDLEDMLTVTGGINNSSTTASLNWSFDSDTEAFDYLANGEKLTLTYTVKALDDSGDAMSFDTHDIVLTITGTNDAPVLSVESSDSDAETLTETNAGLTVSDTITLTDLDLSDAVSVTVKSVAESGDVSGIPNSTLKGMLTIPGSLDNSETVEALGWTFDSGTEAFNYLADSEQLVLTYTIEVSDGVATDTHDIVIRINGTNDTPVLSVETGDSDTETLTETNAGLTVSDSLTLTDLDVTDTVTVAVSSVAESGTTSGILNSTLLNMLSVTAGNILDNSETQDTFNWTFDSGTEAFNYLAAGETLTLKYTVTATDSKGGTDTHEITINIEGTNDAPVITKDTGDSDSAALTETNAGVSASGTLSVEDLDRTDVVSFSKVSVTESGVTAGLGSDNNDLLAMFTVGGGINNLSTTGDLSWNFNSGAESFDYLSAGEELTLTYRVQAVDDSGQVNDTATYDIVIKITGTNDAPAISLAGADSAAESVTETDTTLNTSGSLSLTDLDRTDTVTPRVLSFAKGGDVTGLTVSDTDLENMLSIAGGINNTSTTGTINWTFNSSGESFDYLRTGQALVLTYTIEVEDGSGVKDTQDIVITVNGTNDSPVVAAINDATDENGPVLNRNLLETASDVDNSETLTVENVVVTVSGPAAGPVVYTVSPAGVLTLDPSQFNYLATDQQLIITFTYDVKDNSGVGVGDADNEADSTSNTFTLLIGGQFDPVVNNSNNSVFNTNGQFGSFFIQRFGAGVVPLDPATVTPFQGNSLRFLAAGSSLQFDQEFLGEDPLGVVSGIFDGSVELEEEVADTGNVEQEVKDKEVYDKPQLDKSDLKFIEDLRDLEEAEEDEEEEANELSFESSEQSLMEITSNGEIDIPVLAQKDLDNRVNLEDTLVGDFDCFKPEE